MNIFGRGQLYMYEAPMCLVQKSNRVLYLHLLAFYSVSYKTGILQNSIKGLRSLSTISLPTALVGVVAEETNPIQYKLNTTAFVSLIARLILVK